jgi:hypothetical protein
LPNVESLTSHHADIAAAQPRHPTFSYIRNNGFNNNAARCHAQPLARNTFDPFQSAAHCHKMSTPEVVAYHILLRTAPAASTAMEPGSCLSLCDHHTANHVHPD